MTVTTNERGQNNMWALEPKVYISDEDAIKYGIKTYAERAELTNCSNRILCNYWTPLLWGAMMSEAIFTITSIAFFVLLAHSINQLSETY